MCNKYISNVKKSNLNNFIKIILGKVIEKKKIISVINFKNKKKNIFKIIISDSSGCVNIFSTALTNVRVGDIIKVSKSKVFFHRNSFKIIGIHCESINFFPRNNFFTVDLQKNYSKEKYKVILL